MNLLRIVTVALATALAHTPAFADRLTLAFTPDPTRDRSAALSPEGCYLEPGPAQGLLTHTAAGSMCHSGHFGPYPRTGVRVDDADYSVGIPDTSFTTEPLAAPLTIGGRTTLGLHIANEEPGGDVYPMPQVLYRIEEIRSEGEVISIASGGAMYAHGTYGARGAVTFEIPVYTLDAGSRLRVNLTVSGPTTARLLFGETPMPVGTWPEHHKFADAGITFEDVPEGSAHALDGTIGSGSFGLWLLPLLAAGLARRRMRAGMAFLGCAIASPGAAAGSGPFFAFTPDPALEADAGALSPEGCIVEGLARGSLTPSSAASACHSGQWATDANACGGLLCAPTHETKARFDTAPLEQPLAVGGPATLVLYYFAANENHSPVPAAPYPEPVRAFVEYTIEDVPPGALSATGIVSGRDIEINPGGTGGVYRGEGYLEIPDYTIPAEHRLRVTITSMGSPDGRILFGGAPLASTPAFGARESYHDAGITFLGAQDASAANVAAGGSLQSGLLATLLVFALGRLSRACA